MNQDKKKKKKHHHKYTSELRRYLRLKDMHEGSPRQVLEVVNREYINLWGS